MGGGVGAGWARRRNGEQHGRSLRRVPPGLVVQDGAVHAEAERSEGGSSLAERKLPPLDPRRKPSTPEPSDSPDTPALTPSTP